jgi:hypothetical protein
MKTAFSGDFTPPTTCLENGGQSLNDIFILGEPQVLSQSGLGIKASFRPLHCKVVAVAPAIA